MRIRSSNKGVMTMQSRIQSCQTQLQTDSTLMTLEKKRGLIPRAQRDREVTNQIAAPPIGGLIIEAEADIVIRVMKAMVLRVAEAIARMLATSSIKSGQILANTG